MNYISSIRYFVLLGCCLAVIAIFGCSEKVVNDDSLIFNGNLAIDIQSSPAETMQLIDFYRLTVSGPDMDTVVDTLRLVSGHYVVGEVQVPVGERRLFVLEGITRGSTRVIYRGQTIATVSPGEVTTLNIVLLPVAPLAKLSPMYTEVVAGVDLSLELKLYNLPPVSSFWTLIEFDRTYIHSPSVSRGSNLSENVVLQLEEYDQPWLGITVTNTTGASIVNELGQAVPAVISFFTKTMVGEVPSNTSVDILNVMGVGVGVGLEGDSIGSETIFMEGAQVRLLPMTDRIVVFPDSVLDHIIRVLDTIPSSQPIMLSDIIDHTDLNFGERGVADLTGIENMMNLTYLQMSWNPIADISPLAELTRMTYLYAEDNGISDISPLANLTSMRTLDLEVNWIGDVSPLASMEMLSNLQLGNNTISDITPLAGLTNLYYLYLGANKIVDISALEYLTNLSYLDLHGNQITDILPLVNNNGLDSGDVVEIWNNTALVEDEIQIGYINTLRSREVIVYDYQPVK